MRLKDSAARQGIHYQTARKWFRDGNHPVPALQTPWGMILVQPDAVPPPAGGLGLYARVSSHVRRADLDWQVSRLIRWASTEQVLVVRVEAEIASGITGRPSEAAAAAGRPGGGHAGGDPSGPVGADER